MGVSIMATRKPLSNLQLELLKLYSVPLSESELLEVKQLLAKHFANRLTRHVDDIWQEKGLTKDDVEQWLHDENQ
jgi:hypothetical protein